MPKEIKIEEIFLRLPHVGEQILEELDNQSLTKCREVSKYWKNFIDNQKIKYIRMIEGNI